MAIRLPVRSRRGNALLASIGAIYAVAALGVLARLVSDVWGATVSTDVLLQIALVATAAFGVWLVTVARENLRESHRSASGTSNAASIQR